MGASMGGAAEGGRGGMGGYAQHPQQHRAPVGDHYAAPPTRAPVGDHYAAPPTGSAYSRLPPVPGMSEYTGGGGSGRASLGGGGLGASQRPRGNPGGRY